MTEADTLSDIRRRLRVIDGNLDDMLEGQKLYLDPEKSEDADFIAIIHSFYAEDFDDSYDRNLDTKPEMYYITPDDIEAGREETLLKADTSVHPLHTNLVAAAERVRKNASGRFGIENLVIAGADPHFRNSQNYEALFERSNNLFLHANSDAVALSQTVKAMLRVIDDQEPEPRAIFLDNTSGRLEPFLKAIGLDYTESRSWFNDKLNATVSHPVHVSVIDEKGMGLDRVNALAFQKEQALEALPPLFEAMFFSTSSEEKRADFERVEETSSYALRIEDAAALGGGNISGEELKYTFGGNALDKLKRILNQKLGEPNLDDKLGALGLTRDSAFIIVADGGESLAHERIAQSPIFDGIRDKFSPFAEFPASETKPVSNDVGNGAKSSFYVRLAQAYDDTKTNGKPDFRAVDNCVILIAPLAQDDLHRPTYYAFKNKSFIEIGFEPRPSHDAHPTQRHFQTPKGYEKTIAELEEANDPWMANGLAISGALLLVAKASHAPKRAVELKRDFDKDRVVKATAPWPDMPEKTISKLGKQDVRLSEYKPLDDFADVRRFLRNSDAYLFVDTPQAAGENFWMSRIFAPSCVVVAKQLGEPSVNGKPAVFLGAKEGQRSEVETLLDHIKGAGMIAQDLTNPNFGLYKAARSPKDAAEYIRRKTEPSQKLPAEEKKFKREELPPVEGRTVLHLLSASSEAKVDNDDAYASAANWAMNGYNLMSGMGAQHPMGWAVWAGLQARREGFDVDVQGVQDPYAMDGEGWPQDAMTSVMGPGHAQVAPDILVRIQQLIQLERLPKMIEEDPDYKHLIVSHANGAGGLQEIAAILALKEAGAPGMDHVHLIINNHPRVIHGEDVGPHDALIDLLERRGEMENIYVCDSVEGEMRLASQITGETFHFYDVRRPVDTPYPFVREANPHYDWLLNTHQGADMELDNLARARDSGHVRTYDAGVLRLDDFSKKPGND